MDSKHKTSEVISHHDNVNEPLSGSDNTTDDVNVTDKDELST